MELIGTTSCHGDPESGVLGPSLPPFYKVMGRFWFKHGGTSRWALLKLVLGNMDIV